MRESTNPHFYDFGTFGRVSGSPNQLSLSSETPGYLQKNPEKSVGISKTYFLYRSLDVGHPAFIVCEAPEVIQIGPEATIIITNWPKSETMATSTNICFLQNPTTPNVRCWSERRPDSTPHPFFEWHGRKYEKSKVSGYPNGLPKFSPVR